MKDHLLVFVPGILGTELIYKGKGPFGALVEEPVWTENASILFDTLASRPERLRASTPLSTGSILNQVGFKYLKKIDLYGPLLHFLVDQLGYVADKSFLPFAYDWRQTNITSANILALTLRTRFPGDLPIKFVAHSMGGVVVRLLLSNPANLDLKKRTSGFVQIGVPVRGSSKAFKTLKHSPNFGIVFNYLLSINSHMDPRLYARLMLSLNSFPSLFELMPPDSERIAVMSTDSSFPALHKDFWLDLPDREMRFASVRQVQKQLSADTVPHSLVIYSVDIQTERDYLVDETFVFTNRVERFVVGDGTVSVGSATLGANESELHTIAGGIEHDKLQNDSNQVWSLLRKELDN